MITGSIFMSGHLYLSASQFVTIRMLTNPYLKTNPYFMNYCVHLQMHSNICWFLFHCIMMTCVCWHCMLWHSIHGETFTEKTYTADNLSRKRSSSFRQVQKLPQTVKSTNSIASLYYWSWHFLLYSLRQFIHKYYILEHNSTLKSVFL